MYNNIQAATVKGTGLSGYVQRSRAAVANRPTSETAAGEGGEAAAVGGINPLTERRSQKENEELARRLAAHKAIREVKLRVLLYRESRLEAGIAPGALLDRECAELYDSLIARVKAEQRLAQRAHDLKAAERFAQALGVRPTGGTAVDRAAQETAQQQRELERRQRLEQQLVERLKRVRQDGEATTEETSPS